MRRWMMAGNWKMHNTVAESTELARSIVDGSKGVSDGDIVIAPVFTALAKVYDVVKGSQVALAAQDVFSEERGAYTGEIAPGMLKDAGCRYVIIGHSERRKYFHETDETVNAKVKKSLTTGLKPILCVGETEEEREKGVTDFVIGLQVTKGLNGVDTLDDVTVAYEPVWAIGTGKTATPDQAEAVHRFIRGILRDKYGNDGAENTRILYGGSVTPDNVGQLMKENDVDGALIGGASLKSESFLSIIRAVSGR
jgi:triosephosphate isomerase (TIM)